jgi:hypothetical protein
VVDRKLDRQGKLARRVASFFGRNTGAVILTEEKLVFFLSTTVRSCTTASSQLCIGIRTTWKEEKG